MSGKGKKKAIVADLSDASEESDTEVAAAPAPVPQAVRAAALELLNAVETMTDDDFHAYVQREIPDDPATLAKCLRFVLRPFNPKKLKSLLTRGVSPDLPLDSWNLSPVFYADGAWMYGENEGEYICACTILAEHRADFDVEDPEGTTALSYFVNHVESDRPWTNPRAWVCLDALIAAGVDLNYANSQNKTVLMHPYPETILRHLINAGAEVNLKVAGYTPLHRAIERNDSKGIKLFLERGADPNITVDTIELSIPDPVNRFKRIKVSKHNLTALEHAEALKLPVAGYIREFVESRSQAVTDVVATATVDEDEDPPSAAPASTTLAESSVSGFLTAFNNPDPGVLETYTSLHSVLGDLEPQKNALKMAVQKFDPRRLSALLKWGIDPNIQDMSGYTPLMYGDDAKVRDFFTDQLTCACTILAAYGADVNFREKKGTTALELYVHRAEHTSDTDKYACLDALIAAGADINTPFSDNRTCLFGDTTSKTFAHLIDVGADVNKRVKGMTPLHWFIERDQAEHVKILLERGADPDITIDEVRLGHDKIKFDLTAMQHANARDNSTADVIREFLASRGAAPPPQLPKSTVAAAAAAVALEDYVDSPENRRLARQRKNALAPRRPAPPKKTPPAPAPRRAAPPKSSKKPRSGINETLLAAIRSRDVEGVNESLARGADARAITPEGRPVLAIALMEFPDAADHFVDRGAVPMIRGHGIDGDLTPEAVDSSVMTEIGRPEEQWVAIRFLDKHGIIERRIKAYAETAIINEENEHLRAFLRLGIDLGRKTDGMTLLDVAIEHGNNEAAEILIAAGAPVESEADNHVHALIPIASRSLVESEEDKRRREECASTAAAFVECLDALSVLASVATLASAAETIGYPDSPVAPPYSPLTNVAEEEDEDGVEEEEEEEDDEEHDYGFDKKDSAWTQLRISERINLDRSRAPAASSPPSPSYSPWSPSQGPIDAPPRSPVGPQSSTTPPGSPSYHPSGPVVYDSDPWSPE